MAGCSSPAVAPASARPSAGCSQSAAGRWPSPTSTGRGRPGGGGDRRCALRTRRHQPRPRSREPWTRRRPRSGRSTPGSPTPASRRWRLSRHRRGGVGPQPRRQREGRLPHRPGGRPAVHRAGGGGVDRQHRVDGRQTRRRPVPRPLRRLQVRRRGPHAGDGRGARAARHPRQLRVPRVRGDLDAGARARVGGGASRHDAPTRSGSRTSPTRRWAASRPAEDVRDSSRSCWDQTRCSSPARRCINGGSFMD